MKNRLAAGLGANDAPAKPLTKRYAIYKSKVLRRKAKRDLSLTGNMLRNLTLRTVSGKAAKASLTSQGPDQRTRERTGRAVAGHLAGQQRGCGQDGVRKNSHR